MINEDFNANLFEKKCILILFHLMTQYPIKNPQLLIKSGGVLVFIIAMFFVQSIPEYNKLSPGWCALIGVLFLLIISGK